MNIQSSINNLTSLLGIRRSGLLLLLGAIFVGLLVRVPGIFWGDNFPTGWYGHHVDEYTHLVNAETLIAPAATPRWTPHPYPKGMAAHVAVPVLLLHLLKGERIFDNPPPPEGIIVPGRIISVLYGTASILIVFLLARLLFKDPRIALLSAWFFALGGLHVTQSHFFLSDVPSLFWLLLGTFFLLRELITPNKGDWMSLSGAALCIGISVGLKLNVSILPTLGIVALWYQPRIKRSIQTAVFFFVGFVLVNMASYSPYDLFMTLKSGTVAQFEFSWLSSLALYLIELPSIVSFPVFLLFTIGSILLIRKFIKVIDRRSLLPLMVAVVLPMLIYIVLMVTKIAPFPRHIVPLIPWISLIAALGLIKIIDGLGTKGLHPALIIVPVFIYLAFFIYDGERVFIDEPRNQAAQWIMDNVAPGSTISWFGKEWKPGYSFIDYPGPGSPSAIVIEMHHANSVLSGMGLKNSYPQDIRYIYKGKYVSTQDDLESLQSLFRGTSQYKEAARFGERYFMPEYVLVDGLIGNRSRNYVTEIVIFR